MDEFRPDEVFNGDALAHNGRVVDALRTFSSLLAGVCAGVLGVTGWWQGALVYALVTLITSALIYQKAKGRVAAYFAPSASPLYDGAFTGLMTYLMFWTLFYDVAHVYTPL